MANTRKNAYSATDLVVASLRKRSHSKHRADTEKAARAATATSAATNASTAVVKPSISSSDTHPAAAATTLRISGNAAEGELQSGKGRTRWKPPKGKPAQVEYLYLMQHLQSSVPPWLAQLIVSIQLMPVFATRGLSQLIVCVRHPHIPQPTPQRHQSHPKQGKLRRQKSQTHLLLTLRQK